MIVNPPHFHHDPGHLDEVVGVMRELGGGSGRGTVLAMTELLVLLLVALVMLAHWLDPSLFCLCSCPECSGR